MSEIQISREGRVQIVRFNRAEKKNAITRAMYAQLADAVTAADNDDGIGATLFLGQTEVFTSGNDLMDFMAAATGGEKGTEVIDFLRSIITGTKPLIAGIDGLAVGIGCTMLMHCDLVYASQRAWVQTPFTDLGLVPEAASSLVASRIMGPQRAFELLALSEKFSAEKAQAAGLVNAVVDITELEAQAMAAAKKLAEKPAESMRLTRELIRGDRTEIIDQMEKEGAIFAERLQSDEARNAFLAFMNRGKS